MQVGNLRRYKTRIGERAIRIWIESKENNSKMKNIMFLIYKNQI